MKIEESPKPGDRVRQNQPPHIEGVVVVTFYEVGRGLHMRHEHGVSWASSDDVEVLERAGAEATSRRGRAR